MISSLATTLITRLVSKRLLSFSSSNAELCNGRLNSAVEALVVQIDPEKVLVLKQMTSLTTKKSTPDLSWIIKIHGSLMIPYLSSVTDPLRNLFKDSSLFSRNPAHQQACNAINNAISAETTLAYYDPIKDVIVQDEASTTGLRVKLLQDNNPISFASETLRETNLRHAKVESEFLALFLIFITECDHKPMEAIKWKTIVSAPPKMQRTHLEITDIGRNHQISTGQTNSSSWQPLKALIWGICLYTWSLRQNTRWKPRILTWIFAENSIRNS